jgi:C-terminal processing protease CtpA/Prc
MRILECILCLLFLLSCRNAEGDVPQDTESAETAPAAYREGSLTQADRVVGLAQVYQTCQQYFAWFEQVPDLDWTKAFQEYLPAVEKDQDTLAYYRTLQRFVALLEDGHTEVLLPSRLKNSLDNLPLLVDYVEHQYVVVERMPSPEILEDDIPSGTVLLTINGDDTEDWLKAHVFPFTSNPAMHAKRLAFNSMRCFSKGEKVSLGVRYPDGTSHVRLITANRDEIQWNKDLRERFRRPWTRRPVFGTEPLTEHTVYIRYGECTSDVEQSFCKYMEALDKSKIQTLILDLRSNPGGDTPAKSLQQLLSEPLIDPVIMRMRCSISCMDANCALMRKRGISEKEIARQVQAAVDHGDLPIGYSLGWLQPETHIEGSENAFTGRLLVLINGETGSAAEEFTAILQARKGTTLIGESTAGSTGTPIYFDLPGGGQVRVCTLQVRYPNGDTYVDRGILPDIAVDRTIRGICDGADQVMERALRVAESTPSGQ